MGSPSIFTYWQKGVSALVMIAFVMTSINLPVVHAQDIMLPKPGEMVRLSSTCSPAMLKGIKVHPDNPFRFDFILDKGDGYLDSAQLKDESSKLIKYFLASLTTPEKDMWVNLSPYEKDRIVPESFGLTEMGRDLLAQDYMLKQITASLIYPEDETGKKFWKRVYEESAKKFGTTNIPVNTFNKVWIVPEKAVVYENAKAGTAYVVESKLKVMLEQDYLAMDKNSVIARSQATKQSETASIGSQIVREVVIPQLTKEVNNSKNFIKLRQVYQSLILAAWYKKKIKDSILSQVYADQNKVDGIKYTNSVIASGAKQSDQELIYERYLQAFKKGVYNYIKEQQDPLTQQMIPRKYFSGGMSMAMAVLSITQNAVHIERSDNAVIVTAGIDRADSALSGDAMVEKHINDDIARDILRKGLNLDTIEYKIRLVMSRVEDRSISLRNLEGFVSSAIYLLPQLESRIKAWHQAVIQDLQKKVFDEKKINLSYAAFLGTADFKLLSRGALDSKYLIAIPEEIAYLISQALNPIADRLIVQERAAELIRSYAQGKGYVGAALRYAEKKNHWLGCLKV